MTWKFGFEGGNMGEIKVKKKRNFAIVIEIC
jgi:hypothetical protein